MTRGVLMYAHNNTEIDYIRIACANALMVKKNLKVPVTLVTDSGTLGWAKKDLGEEFVNDCFEKIIEVNRNYKFNNMRNFSDTSYSSKSIQFYNCNHWEAYDLSPYDETLFIDADYLVMSDILNNCWGSTEDIMINHSIHSPGDEGAPKSKNIDDLGIKLYWATVIYFKKSSMAEHFFSIMKHVQENYEYYKDLYFFANRMFRNDHAASIAVHMLNGYADSGAIKELPINGLLMCWDTDDIHSLPGVNDIVVYTEKKNQKGNYLLARFKNTDIHIMNKWAINRHAKKLISLYKD